MRASLTFAFLASLFVLGHAKVSSTENAEFRAETAIALIRADRLMNQEFDRCFAAVGNTLIQAGKVAAEQLLM